MQRRIEDGFPRLKKRGSIEARQAGWPEELIPTFPRLKKRGSIEAYPAGFPAVILDVFPRLKKRGSIEAAPFSPAQDINTHFHA